VVLKNYYELLEIPPASSIDEVKKAFRQQIARYHPDKVQHLGKEFQAMAAERAAELTEAYRVLSDEGRRAEFDRAWSEASGGKPAPAAPASGASGPAAYTEPAPRVPSQDAETHRSTGPQFKHERDTRDTFVRNATVSRFRQALDAIGGGYEESELRGFDLVWLPKSKIFGRAKGPRMLGRFVSRVDGESVAETWTQASKWAPGEEVCVFLIGSRMAPPSELASAIAESRRKARSTKVTLIPVDARTWDAHLPHDAPGIAKTLLTRVKSST
jgi:curved DNA-binding protein CbpA